MDQVRTQRISWKLPLCHLLGRTRRGHRAPRLLPEETELGQVGLDGPGGLSQAQRFCDPEALEGTSSGQKHRALTRATKAAAAGHGLWIPGSLAKLLPSSSPAAPAPAKAALGLRNPESPGAGQRGGTGRRAAPPGVTRTRQECPEVHQGATADNYFRNQP